MSPPLQRRRMIAPFAHSRKAAHSTSNTNRSLCARVPPARAKEGNGGSKNKIKYLVNDLHLFSLLCLLFTTAVPSCATVPVLHHCTFFHSWTLSGQKKVPTAKSPKADGRRRKEGTDTCCRRVLRDRGITFRLMKCFLKDGAPYPKIVGKYAPLIFAMIFSLRT